MRAGGMSASLGLAACLGGALLAWPAAGAGPGTPGPPLVGLPFDAERARSLQGEWAKALGLDAEVTNSVGMRLVLIPGGRFDMGPDGGKCRVTLARPFYLGVTEVTLGQYRRFKPGHRVEGADAEFKEDDRPAAMVSWHDARAFCAWLSERPEETAAGRAYTLPTEAHWEWAARAGTATSRHFGDTDRGQADYSWFNVTYTPNPRHEGDGRGRQPVGKLRPNAWGLFDMLGNVWEWCEDRRGDEATGESRDPVMRGGSWRSGAFHCTAVARDPGDPDLRSDNIGFRVACHVDKGK
jgi:formylglycine-generating enzyme required for sulfatase activity